MKEIPCWKWTIITNDTSIIGPVGQLIPQRRYIALVKKMFYQKWCGFLDWGVIYI